ncbi:MAG: cytochrome P450/oxidoreductase [Rubrivivax sp.]
MAVPLTPVGCPVSAGAAAFDPFGDGYQQNPAAYLRWSRAQEPVFWSPLLGYWVVTRHASIRAIFRDPHTFSPSIALEKITPTSAEATAALAGYGFALNRTLVNEDEPAHMPRRRALMAPFSPDALQAHEPLVRRLANEAVDRFIDSGRADLVEQMLWEVPLTVALHFLGVPEEDMPTLRRYSIAHTVNTWGRPKPDEQLAVAHAVGHFWQYAGRVLDKMRTDPAIRNGPGWMPYSIRQQARQPDVVTDSYLHSMMMAIIVAAHETTAHASANAMKQLLSQPQVWRQLCEDPALIPNAVDECLRHDGSVAAWRRLATSDVVIDGVSIAAGSKLLIVTASGNHDPRRFEDPDALDIRRDNATDHLTFGHGAHQCLGRELARMEMQVFIQTFARRLPHLRLSEQPFSYVPNTSFRGPEHLWVEWDPALNPERRDSLLRGAQTPLRIGEPLRRAAMRPVVVDRITEIADGVRSLRLVAPPGQTLPRWTAGGHIDVEFDVDAAAGLSIGTRPSRSYSLCGDPDGEPDAYPIAVLHEPEGRGGSRWLHETLRVGDRLDIRGPRNHFRLDEQAPALLLIAGGIGITPIISMALRAKTLGMSYALHYCGRSRRAMAFVDALKAAHGSQMKLHVADEGTRADLPALLAQMRSAEPGTHVYACGPPRMLQALAAVASDVGWPADAVHTEHFVSTLTELDPSLEHAFEVELADTGRTVQVAADQTLLSALRNAGLAILSDCEEGLCGSCEVSVLQGEVDHRDQVLTTAERATGSKLMSCCSRARGGRLVLGL